MFLKRYDKINILILIKINDCNDCENEENSYFAYSRFTLH